MPSATWCEPGVHIYRGDKLFICLRITRGRLAWFALWVARARSPSLLYRLSSESFISNTRYSPWKFQKLTRDIESATNKVSFLSLSLFCSWNDEFDRLNSFSQNNTGNFTSKAWKRMVIQCCFLLLNILQIISSNTLSNDLFKSYRSDLSRFTT